MASTTDQDGAGFVCLTVFSSSPVLRAPAAVQPAAAQAIVKHEVESGRFASSEDVIVEVLRHLHDDNVPYVADEPLITARKQADRGETRVLTEAVWKEIRERASDDTRNGVPIPDDITF